MTVSDDGAGHDRRLSPDAGRGEIRAGLRTAPGPDEAVHPVEKMFLATTGAAKQLEDDLAQSFGPEEAHRLVFAPEICMGTSHFGGDTGVPKPASSK